MATIPSQAHSSDDFPALPADRFGPQANELPVEMARFSSIAFLDQNYLLAPTAIHPGGAWNPVKDLDPGSGGSFQDGVYVSDDGRAWAHLYVGNVGGQNTLVIAFRGTDDLRDGLLDYVPEFAPHWDRFDPLVSQVRPYIDRYAVREVYVTGHSLGGAMAQWFLSEFQDGAGVQYHAFTFGSPGGPGGDDTEPRMLHFEHVDDPVPDVGVLVGAVRDGTRWRIDRDDNGSSPLDDHHKALYVESLELLAGAGVPLLPPAFVNQSANLFKGTDGNETIEGNNGVDVLYGMGGDDVIVGEGGNDAMLAGAGDDTVRAGPGDDRLFGAAGGDTLFGGDGNDTIDGGEGDDLIDGGGGVDSSLYASAFRLYSLTGNPVATASIEGPDGVDSPSLVENLVFLDGRRTFDPADFMAQAYRLYFATLDREPDALGLNYQSARLDAGTSLVDVASGFVNSPEFQATYGPLDDTQFVELLYQNVLDRGAAPDEIAYHVGRLQSGASRADVVVGFSEAPEHIQKHIDAVNAGLWDIDEGLASISRLYFGMLERTPETAGLVYYKDALAQGLTVPEVANNFAASPEFQAKYGALDDPAYVTQLYLNILERAPAADEVAYHVGRLDAGATRGDVAAGFTEAPEYQQITLPLVDQGIAVADAGFVLT